MEHHPQDLRAHLAYLESRQKLWRISRPINKDTELMPLVRWEFRGLPESERRGFWFEQVTGPGGKSYEGSVAVAIYAASTEMYAMSLGCAPEDIHVRWREAQAHPIPPRIVSAGPVQEEVHLGADLLEKGGLDEFPIPLSTPGFDVAPYTTASNWVTRDPSGWLNVGNYRGHIKGPDRIGLFLSPRNHGWKHWDSARQAGKPLEAALVIGGPPAVAFTSCSRIPFGVEEYAVAGALVGEPIELVPCKTVDLLVPAWAELVIEGVIATDALEPEAPFGEYTGYMGERVFNPYFQVTAITHRKRPIFVTLLSQMPPSESSKIKSIAQDNIYLHHLRDACNNPNVVDVAVAEIAVDSWMVIQMRPSHTAAVWQALYAAAGRHTMVGKMIIAVDEDIDPRDFESVVWALSYRANPARDFVILPNRSVGLDPSGHPPLGTVMDNTVEQRLGSVCLIDATRKWGYPPVSLPAKDHMLRARGIWEELGLPRLTPRVPWFGYELGDWTDRDREEAAWAEEGNSHLTGERAKEQRRPLGPRE